MTSPGHGLLRLVAQPLLLLLLLLVLLLLVAVVCIASAVMYSLQGLIIIILLCIAGWQMLRSGKGATSAHQTGRQGHMEKQDSRNYSISHTCPVV
jgi:threonine/homoserine/homoserine lactone efflux protein